MSKIDLTQEELRRVLGYDPTTGIFRWLVALGRRVKVGAQAGGISSVGYIVIRVHKQIYQAHRLAFLYVTGRWPSDDMDHVNGDRKDNRFANLREATRGENCMNRARPSNNKSGFKGVCFRRSNNKWAAQIGTKNRMIHLGYFTSPGAAAAAYDQAANKHHGQFKRAS